MTTIIVQKRGLWSNGEWIDFISDETHRLVLTDRPLKALLFLDEAVRIGLNQPKFDQRTLWDLLSRYPRNFWKELRPGIVDLDNLMKLALAAAILGDDAKWHRLFGYISKSAGDPELLRLGTALTEAGQFERASISLGLITNRKMAEPATWLNEWAKTTLRSKNIPSSEFDAWISVGKEQSDARANLLVERLLSSGSPLMR